MMVVVAVALVATFGVATAQAATITYNLYATDAYIPLADGTCIYNYGFVGGRAGQALTFQNSVKPDGTFDPAAGQWASFIYQDNTTIDTGAPTPVGGPVTDAEKPLLGNAQFPAPLIYCRVGDVVQINFKNLGVKNPNAPNDPHSIHLHGLDVAAANDGVPETSVGAVPANAVDSGGQPVPGAGNVVVYMFSPKTAGTYFYHCHQEADIHVQMGMYGALVVYNKTDVAADFGPGTGHRGSMFGWSYDKDYVLLESEIDTRQHGSEETSGNFNPVDYHPEYWCLNGLSFPNTIHVGLPGGWDNWIAAHPGYDPFITGSVSRTHSNPAIPVGDKVLLRMINMG
ncbi:MAG TPA: multicopper oxidase domain-containing protein, partial [Thermoleophilia bacterium]|nr:multicopper oxidase domain-containing protein [Thermoleophilia bacterium]